MKRRTALLLSIVLMGALLLPGCDDTKDLKAFNDAIDTANRQTDEYNRIDGELTALTDEYYAAIEQADVATAKEFAGKIISAVDEQDECVKTSSAALSKITGDGFKVEERTYAKQQVAINDLMLELDEVFKDTITRQLDYSTLLADKATPAEQLGIVEEELRALEAKAAKLDGQIDELTQESDEYYRKNLDAGQ